MRRNFPSILWVLDREFQVDESSLTPQLEDMETDRFKIGSFQ
jgi:hypothetical protein